MIQRFSGILLLSIILFLSISAGAAAKVNPKSKIKARKFFLSPNLNVGLTSGYDHNKGMNLDFQYPGVAAQLELRVGVNLNKNWQVYSGYGIGLYNYRLKYANLDGLPEHEMVRNQSEDIIEVPLGVRYCTAPIKPFKTRHYLGAGLRLSFLNDARSDWHSADLSIGGNETKAEDFHKLFVKLYVESGLEIPLDYNSSFLLGMCLSDGITRNMSKTGAISNANFGILAFTLNLGFKFNLGR